MYRPRGTVSPDPDASQDGLELGDAAVRHLVVQLVVVHVVNDAPVERLHLQDDERHHRHQPRQQQAAPSPGCATRVRQKCLYNHATSDAERYHEDAVGIERLWQCGCSPSVLASSMRSTIKMPSSTIYLAVVPAAANVVAVQVRHHHALRRVVRVEQRPQARAALRVRQVPVLGRLALAVHPDLVRVHWLVAHGGHVLEAVAVHVEVVVLAEGVHGQLALHFVAVEHPFLRWYSPAG